VVWERAESAPPHGSRSSAEAPAESLRTRPGNSTQQGGRAPSRSPTPAVVTLRHCASELSFHHVSRFISPAVTQTPQSIPIFEQALCQRHHEDHSGPGSAEAGLNVPVAGTRTCGRGSGGKFLGRNGERISFGMRRAEGLPGSVNASGEVQDFTRRIFHFLEKLFCRKNFSRRRMKSLTSA